jgi:hypothetical protein
MFNMQSFKIKIQLIFQMYSQVVPWQRVKISFQD